MPCYHPLRLESERGLVRVVPCGQCIGCRLERSRQWAVRLVHESKLHEKSCFVTLTYAPEHLPPGGTLVPEDLRLFIKRVRHWALPGRVRFFACGEYGDALGRPHYHALLFGVWFSEGALLGGEGAASYWRSDQLSGLWSKGHASFGRVTFESAAYVARYVLKKVTGAGAPAHYGDRVPEFVRMSRRPGIGQGFFFGIVRIFILATSVLFAGK